MRLTKQQGNALIIVLVLAILATLASLLDKGEVSDSPDASWYYQHGLEFENEFNYDSALSYFEEALRLAPNHAGAHSHRCNILNRFGRSEEALIDCNRAIELDSSFIHAYASRCLVYQALNRFEEALADCNHAIEAEPNESTWYNSRGLVYSNEGNGELAIEDFNRSLELEPENAIIIYNRGRVHYDLNQLPEAIADFEEAIELSGELWFAYVGLSYSYYDNDSTEKAFTTANLMIERLPYNPESYHNRGNLYYWERNFTEAEADFLRSIELNDNFLDAYYALALLYSDKMDSDNAARYYCEYRERGGQEEVALAIIALGGCPNWAEATPEATAEQ